MKTEKMPNLIHTHTPDCQKCGGLCCVAFDITKDGGGHFKSVGDICKHLDCSTGRCKIYQTRESQGLSVRRDYSCFGAGEVVSQWSKNLFPGFNRYDENQTININGMSWEEIAKIVDEVFLVTAFVYKRIEFLKEVKKRDGLETERLLEITNKIEAILANLNDFLLKNKEYYSQPNPSQIDLVELRTLGEGLLSDRDDSLTLDTPDGKTIEIFME